MAKKLKYVIMALIMLISTFSLVACDEELKDYNVNVNVWYSNYGIVYGGGTYTETTSATIKATPKGDSEFLAWLHNDIIVSYDAEYTFVVSLETSGTYTAIFTCPDLELIVPKQILFNLDTSMQLTNSKATVLIGSSYNNLNLIFDGETQYLNNYNIQDLTIALDKRLTIIIQVNITFTYDTIIDNETVSIDRQKQTYIELNLQDDQLVTEIENVNLPDGCEGEANINFVFEKFTVPVENI